MLVMPKSIWNESKYQRKRGIDDDKPLQDIVSPDIVSQAIWVDMMSILLLILTTLSSSRIGFLRCNSTSTTLWGLIKWVDDMDMLMIAFERETC